MSAELAARAESFRRSRNTAFESLARLSSIATRIEAELTAKLTAEVLPTGLMEVVERILKPVRIDGLPTGELIDRVLAERPDTARSSIRSVLAKMRQRGLVESRDGRHYHRRDRWPGYPANWPDSQA
jgi:hypothetical protein